MSIKPCDQDVFDNGQSVCLVDIPRETAENICRSLSAATGCKIDWHYVGGRVHIKALAAPVVERQEPVAVAWIKPDVAETLRGDECCYAFGEQNPKGTLIPLYASPVAAEPSLWEICIRDDPGNPESPCEYVYVNNVFDRDSILRRGGAYICGEYACLDKIKELNQ